MQRDKLIRDLLYHVRLGEDSSLEFKAVRLNGTAVVEPHKDKMAHEIAAFANGRGGAIVIGVTDKSREVEGVPVDQAGQVEEWIVNISQQKIEPPVTLHTRLLELPNRQGELKTVIYVEIPRSIMVHSSVGRFYHRIGSTKQIMKTEVLARLFQQRSQSRLIRFDEVAIPTTAVTDIEPSLKARFLKAHIPEREQLRKLHLLATGDEGEDCLSVTGALLLTKEVTDFIPSAFVQCVAYRGLERSADEQLDYCDFTASLERQIQGAFEFVRKNMRVEAVKKIGRVDIPQYHLGAIYEAIVNAVAHRDYSMAGSRIRIHLFADRIEIASPGLLSNNLTIEGLNENTVTRNETLVNLLSRYYEADPVTGRYRPIERRGEGVPKILKESEALSTLRPEYRIVGERELLLTIYAASKERNGVLEGER